MRNGGKGNKMVKVTVIDAKVRQKLTS
jgi:hypothetical protein